MATIEVGIRTTFKLSRRFVTNPGPHCTTAVMFPFAVFAFCQHLAALMRKAPGSALNLMRSAGWSNVCSYACTLSVQVTNKCHSISMNSSQNTTSGTPMTHTRIYWANTLYTKIHCRTTLGFELEIAFLKRNVMLFSYFNSCIVIWWLSNP